MDREKLVLIRNMLLSDVGQNLITFLSDYITSNAVCVKDDIRTAQIVGMCELLEQIKNIPERVERQANK